MAERQIVLRKAFKFHYDESDLLKEFRKFAIQLGEPLADKLKAYKTGNRMLNNAENLLTVMTESPESPRIKTIIKSLYELQSYKSKTTGAPVRRIKPRKVMVGLVNIKNMDKKTNIAVLDRQFPQHHIAPFNDPPNPPKRTGQATKTRPQNALWRIFEYPTKPTYTIPTIAKGPLVYTSSSDGYSRWHISRSVQWKGKNKGAFAAYYILNQQRQVYNEDKVIFKNMVRRAIKVIILTRTRFR